MDGEVKKEQIDTLFVRVGLLQGGFGEIGWVRGVPPIFLRGVPLLSWPSWLKGIICVSFIWQAPGLNPPKISSPCLWPEALPYGCPAIHAPLAEPVSVHVASLRTWCVIYMKEQRAIAYVMCDLHERAKGYCVRDVWFTWKSKGLAQDKPVPKMLYNLGALLSMCGM